MQDCMIRNSDRHRLESPNPKIGELVLLDSDGITIEVEEKIKRKFLGPYRITQVDYDLQNYTLALPKNMKRLHPIFHISKLRIFRERDCANEIKGGAYINSDLSKIEQAQTSNLVGQVYEIEKILDHKIKYRKNHYFIKWRGFGSQFNTWERIDQLDPEEEKLFEDYLQSRGGVMNRKPRASPQSPNI